MWLPLSQHLEDTHRVSERLWELWLNNGKRKLIIDSLSYPTEEKAKQLVQFLGAIHDIAKATPAFQIKKGFANSTDLDIQLLERLERDGFNGITQLKLPSSNKSHHALAGETLLSWYGVNEDIHSIISGHHGKPVDKKKNTNNSLLILKIIFKKNRPIPPSIKREEVQYEIFQWALKSSGFAHINDLPKITQQAK